MRVQTQHSATSLIRLKCVLPPNPLAVGVLSCDARAPPSWAQDCLAVGAIFASTDSVVALQVIKQDKHPLLYSLAFGEGVLNDATSVVLLGAITHFSHPIDLTRGTIARRYRDAPSAIARRYRDAPSAIARRYRVARRMGAEERAGPPPRLSPLYFRLAHKADAPPYSLT